MNSFTPKKKLILDAAKKVSKNGKVVLDDIALAIGDDQPGAKSRICNHIFKLKQTGDWPYQVARSTQHLLGKSLSRLSDLEPWGEKRSDDHEVKVIAEIVNKLLTLSEESQTRVLKYLQERFDNA